TAGTRLTRSTAAEGSRHRRQGGMAGRLQSPLFNTHQFARDIEAAYLAMHERHLQGLPPEVIEV
ncbi:hypothetical protein ACFOW3_16830, partial [Acidovorax facilis]